MGLDCDDPRLTGWLLVFYYDIDPELSKNVRQLFLDWGLAGPTEKDLDACLLDLAGKPKIRPQLIGRFRRRGLTFPPQKRKAYLAEMVETLENCATDDLQYLAALMGGEFRQLASEMLADRLKRLLRPSYPLVRKVREFHLDFPPGPAFQYVAEILEELGAHDFADAEYLLNFANDELLPETLKKYADSALDWHFNRENENRKKDERDHYHAAVECYRRLPPKITELECSREALEFNKPLSPEARKELEQLEKRVALLKLSPVRVNKLLSAVGDPEARMRDVIIAFQLSGNEPKDDELVLAKLRRRIETADTFPARFREKIELAAYLNDHAFTHEVTSELAETLFSELKKEGEAARAAYDAAAATGTPVDPKEYRKWLESSDGPVYRLLNEAVDLMVYLDFRGGLYSLAQRLHDACFYQARRVFGLAGLGKEADAKYYGRHDAAYWQARERRFNYEMRTYGRFDNTK